MTKYIVMQTFKGTGKNLTRPGETRTYYMGKNRRMGETNLVELALVNGYDCKLAVMRKFKQAQADAKRVESHGDWTIDTFLVEVIS